MFFLHFNFFKLRYPHMKMKLAKICEIYTFRYSSMILSKTEFIYISYYNKNGNFDYFLGVMEMGPPFAPPPFTAFRLIMSPNFWLIFPL